MYAWLNYNKTGYKIQFYGTCNVSIYKTVRITICTGHFNMAFNDFNLGLNFKSEFAFGANFFLKLQIKFFIN